MYIIAAFSTKQASLLGFLTRWFTRWRHSHIALISNDGTCLIEATDHGGVRVMPISYLFSRDDVEIRCIDHPYPQAVWEHALTQEGKEYDETYSLGWLFNRNWQDEDKWSCTELIEWAARKAGHALFPDGMGFISPRDFYLISRPIDTTACIIVNNR